MPDGEALVTYPHWKKPNALVRLHDITESLFELLQETFAVPAVFEVRLHHVDGLGDPPDDDRTVAAFAMRETQSLRRATTLGVAVTNAEVVRIACALDAALDHLVRAPGAAVQAPTLLKARDRINEGARAAAALGSGGVVVLV